MYENELGDNNDYFRSAARDLPKKRRGKNDLRWTIFINFRDAWTCLQKKLTFHTKDRKMNRVSSWFRRSHSWATLHCCVDKLEKKSQGKNEQQSSCLPNNFLFFF